MIITNKFIDDLSSDYDLVSQEEYEKAEEQAFQELDYEECTEDQCIMLIQEMLQVDCSSLASSYLFLFSSDSLINPQRVL